MGIPHERLTIDCPECHTTLHVVAEHSGPNDPFQLFVSCLSCGERVHFRRRVGRVITMSRRRIGPAPGDSRRIGAQKSAERPVANDLGAR